MVLALVPDHAGFLKNSMTLVGDRLLIGSRRVTSRELAPAEFSARPRAEPDGGPSLVGSDVLVRGSYFTGQKAAASPNKWPTSLVTEQSRYTCCKESWSTHAPKSKPRSSGGRATINHWLPPGPNLPRKIRSGQGSHLPPAANRVSTRRDPWPRHGFRPA